MVIYINLHSTHVSSKFLLHFSCIYKSSNCIYYANMHFTAILLASIASGAAIARSVPKLTARAYPGLDDTQSRNAEAAINEIRAEGINPGRQACLAVISTALQESTLHIYANPAVPESMNYPHDLVGGDQDSVGKFISATLQAMNQ